jgi:hypothetical protein
MPDPPLFLVPEEVQLYLVPEEEQGYRKELAVVLQIEIPKLA